MTTMRELQAQLPRVVWNITGTRCLGTGLRPLSPSGSPVVTDNWVSLSSHTAGGLEIYSHAVAMTPWWRGKLFLVTFISWEGDFSSLKDTRKKWSCEVSDWLGCGSALSPFLFDSVSEAQRDRSYENLWEFDLSQLHQEYLLLPTRFWFGIPRWLEGSRKCWRCNPFNTQRSHRKFLVTSNWQLTLLGTHTWGLVTQYSEAPQVFR